MCGKTIAVILDCPSFIYTYKLFVYRGRIDMRQKYIISHSNGGKNLTIKEYAVVDKEIKKKTAPVVVLEENFSFRCEEIYDGTVIVNAISQGNDTLIRTLRRRNLFPIGPHMMKIAEAVTTLYDDTEEELSMELLLDDVDLIMPKEEDELSA